MDKSHRGRAGALPVRDSSIFPLCTTMTLHVDGSCWARASGTTSEASDPAGTAYLVPARHTTTMAARTETEKLRSVCARSVRSFTTTCTAIWGTRAERDVPTVSSSAQATVLSCDKSAGPKRRHRWPAQRSTRQWPFT